MSPTRRRPERRRQDGRIGKDGVGLAVEVCRCAFCRTMIYESELDGRTVADLQIWKSGELSSIELAHARCVPVVERRWWRLDGGWGGLVDRQPPTSYGG